MPDKFDIVRNALRNSRSVQAGWAFGVPEDGRDQWLAFATRAVLEALEPPSESKAVVLE